MKRKSYKNLVLFLIYQSNGRWSWYQLERELEWRGIAGKIRVIDIIKGLITDGLITEQTNSTIGSGMPYYKATNEGVTFVNALIDKFGASYFSRRRELKEDYE